MQVLGLRTMFEHHDIKTKVQDSWQLHRYQETKREKEERDDRPLKYYTVLFIIELYCRKRKSEILHLAKGQLVYVELH